MKRYLNQLLAVFLAGLAIFSGGLHTGWAAPSLTKLLDEEADLTLTSDEGSSVVSFLSFGAIFGPLMVTFLADRIGRKWTLIIIILPTLISWPIIGLANSALVLYVGRFFGGLSLGAAYAITPVYSGEVASDRIRGALGVVMNLMINLGVISSYSIGPYVSRQTLSIVCSVPSFILIGSSFWLPETPYYLIMKEKRAEALASLVWLRRTDDVKDEFSRIETSVSLQQRSKSSSLDLVKSGSNRKALLIMAGLLTAQQVTGVTAIQAYVTTIFAQSGSGMSDDLSTIIIGIVKFLSVFLVFFIVDLTGRRPLLIISGILVGFCLVTEGVFFHLQELNYDTSTITWIPLVGIVCFYITYTIGLGSLPYAIIGEMFSTSVKASAVTVLSMYGSVLGTIVSKLYQIVSDDLGVYTVFYGYTVLCVVGLFFIIVFVPETKRRPLQDIQDSLKTGSICMGLPLKNI